MLNVPITAPDLAEEIISSINPPEGWETVDEMQQVKAQNEPLEIERIKRRINLMLPYVAHQIEDLIASVRDRCNIQVSESFLTIDADTAFHAILLVSQDDFLSPKIQAAKILAEQYLNGTKTVGIRYTFTVGEEHLRAHLSDSTHKLRYIPKAT
ncbi:MAG: hypothetical protein H7257_02355 [Taibaiella sp.]|nr:hypothetical protein [Taibaiella sp.]